MSLSQSGLKGVADGLRGSVSLADVLAWIRWLRPYLPFFAIVVIPTLLLGIYYYTVAADEFVSEARFVVRGPAAQASGVFSGLLGNAGMASRGDEDTYAVQDYMLSRDALAALERDDHIREIFNRPEGDPISRFPMLPSWSRFEDLYAYYLRHVDAVLDSTTGLSTLTVRTFRPQDSEDIAHALLAGGERLVNVMNDRQRLNVLAESQREVAAAEARVQAVTRDIAAFRDREAVLDPLKQSVPMLQAISDLQSRLSHIQVQISQTTLASPRSPLIAEYQQLANALRQQIAEQRSRITGSDDSLVPKISAYDALSLQREFAEKQLSSATASLESARLQAERQQIYLDLIVAPNAPDYPLYPRKISSVATFFCSMLGLYVLGALLLAGAREHRLV